MAGNNGPKIITNGLVLCIDAADRKSYTGSGSASWTDLSNNNNTSTLTNNPTFNYENSGSIVLNGSTQYILDSSISNFNVGCIDLWIKPTAIINASSAFSNLLQLKIGTLDADAWNIAFGISTGFLTNEYITIADGSSGASAKRTCVTDGGSLAANTWVNIVFNWESTVYKIYINNIVKITSAPAGGNVGQLITPNMYLLGAFQLNTSAAYSGFFGGAFSIVRIYNRTLMATELLQNYNATKGRFNL